MSDLDLQQILAARYRTSAEADRYTNELRQHLALDTKAQVARMAIGRSLAMGPLADAQLEAKGLDIPATSIFSIDSIGAWIGLIVAQSELEDGFRVNSMDSLRSAIRLHWHRGALALWADWLEAEENFDKFVEILIGRRTEIPEFGPSNALGNAAIADGKPEVTDVSPQLVKTLEELGIKVQVKNVVHGPRLSRYKVALLNLSDLPKLKRNTGNLGLALSLGNASPSVSNSDEAKTVYIDLPRARHQWQFAGPDRLRRWAASESTKVLPPLEVYAGLSVTGEDFSFDIAKLPHLLVGGTTGSGKSVLLHSLILSLIIRNHPEMVQLALIDPKQVEFSAYGKVPHLYGNAIAVEIAQARQCLDSLVDLMEERYAEFNKLGVANIAEARAKGRNIPYIVVFIEELADLILQDDAVEQLIARLAQKARAAGIHLVLATQRPDSETFYGLIRSNVPGRIALSVQKGSESRIILDEKGAEELLGSGDMLLRLPGEQIHRGHAVFVSGKDVTDTLKSLRG